MSVKEEHIMKVSYKGVAGDLVKLEKTDPMLWVRADGTAGSSQRYDLVVYDSEKDAAISFANVNLADVKFRGGEVSFSG